MLTARRTTLAGVVLATAGALLAGCGGLGGSGIGDDTRTVRAELADSAGLFVGNDVGVLGVTIGEITAIEPSGSAVLVTMEVDADQPIPADAGAVVVARSVATDRYIELTPVYRGGEELAADAVIPVDRTRAPVDFDQVLAALNDFATGIGGSAETTDAVQRFIAAGTSALQGRGPLLNQSIHSLAEGIEGIASERDDIAATLSSLDTLVGAVAANEDTARTFIQQVSEASALLADERTNFRTALRALDEAVRTVAEFAVDNRDEIVRGVRGSTRLMKTVLGKQQEVEEILRVMPLALENIRRVPGDRLPVRVDPLLVIDPLGGVLAQVCGRLPGNLCEILDGLQPGG